MERAGTGRRTEAQFGGGGARRQCQKRPDITSKSGTLVPGPHALMREPTRSGEVYCEGLVAACRV